MKSFSKAGGNRVTVPAIQAVAQGCYRVFRESRVRCAATINKMTACQRLGWRAADTSNYNASHRTNRRYA